MGHLIKRRDISRMLRIDADSTSYRLLGRTKGAFSLIDTDAVVAVLNGCRKGPQPLVSDMPGDICTADEAAERLDCGITGRQLVTWCGRRTMHVPPHWRLSSHTRRFSLRILREWIASRSSLVR